MVHRYFVWLHPWTGLLMSVFLIVVGLTGTLLAFRAKLDRLINPELYAEAKPGQAPPRSCNPSRARRGISS